MANKITVEKAARENHEKEDAVTAVKAKKTLRAPKKKFNSLM